MIIHGPDNIIIPVADLHKFCEKNETRIRVITDLLKDETLNVSYEHVHGWKNSKGVVPGSDENNQDIKLDED